MSWLRTLWKVSSRTKKLVGSDLAGNQYFEQLVEGGKNIKGKKNKTIVCSYRVVQIIKLVVVWM